MPARLSKPAPPAAVGPLAAQLFLSCLSIALLLQARPRLVLRLAGGDTARAATLLAKWTSLAALGEFCLGPTFGGLADAWGRRPMMLLSPAVNLVLRTLLVARPSLALARLENVVTSALLGAASISVSASVADLARSGKALAIANAKIGACAGLAFVVGPISAGLLIKRGGPTLAYRASAAVAALQLGLVAVHGRETLPKEDRIPFSLAAASPLSFVRLLAGCGRLRMLTLVGVLQVFCEPKAWSAMTNLYMSHNVGLGPEQVGRFFALLGVGAIGAKVLTRTTIRRAGAAVHTSLSNLATAAAFFSWGANPSSTLLSVVLPLLLAPFSLDRRAGVNARATGAAVAQGLGKGEHAAMFGNLRALAVSAAPLIFGRLYAFASATGRRPGLGFWAAGMFALAAEAVHRNVPRSDADEMDKGDSEDQRGVAGAPVRPAASSGRLTRGGLLTLR